MEPTGSMVGFMKAGPIHVKTGTPHRFEFGLGGAVKRTTWDATWVVVHRHLGTQFESEVRDHTPVWNGIRRNETLSAD